MATTLSGGGNADGVPMSYSRDLAPQAALFEIRLDSTTILLSHSPEALRRRELEKAASSSPPSPSLPAPVVPPGASDGAPTTAPAAEGNDSVAPPPPTDAAPTPTPAPTTETEKEKEPEFKEKSCPDSPSDCITGSVLLHLNEPLDNVRSIDFRFLGGVVSRLDDTEYNCLLRGTDRLFDKEVTLYDGAEKGHKLDAGPHKYQFSIRLPPYMPPTTTAKHIQIQYMLVTTVNVQPTCCATMLPFLFRRNAMLAKHEIIVRRDAYPSPVFEERVGVHQDEMLSDAGEDVVEKPILALSKPDGTAASSDGGTAASTATPTTDGDVVETPAQLSKQSPLPTLVWTPNNDVLVRIPTSIELTQTTLTIRVSLANGATATRLAYTLVQDHDLKFNYTAHPVTSRLDEIDVIDHQLRHELCTGVISTVPVPVVHENKEFEYVFVVEMNVDTDVGSDTERVEDVDATIANVVHTLSLELTVSKPRGGVTDGGDGNGNGEETVSVNCPIVVYRDVSTCVSSAVTTADTIADAVADTAAPVVPDTTATPASKSDVVDTVPDTLDEAVSNGVDEQVMPSAVDSATEGLRKRK